jgi:hypothetical protein
MDARQVYRRSFLEKVEGEAVGQIINKPAQTVADVIHFAQYNMAIPLIEAAAIAALPWLGNPFIRPIMHWILTYLTDKIYPQLAALGVNFTIKLQTEAQKSAFYEEEKKLRAIDLAYRTGTADAAKLKEATDEFIKKARALGKFDGSVRV